MGIVKAFDPATGASGGATENVPTLNAATPPSLANLSSGTTSHNFVFNAASGGEGTITYGSAITQSGSGASIDSTTDGGSTVTVAVSGLTPGNDIEIALTATDGASQTAVARAFASVAAAVANPPVLADPAVSSIVLGASDPSVNFTNSGGAIASSSASITDAPSGHSATVANTSGSLTVTLTAPDKAGTYTVDYTGTNSDGSAGGRAVFEVTSDKPTANAGATQQHNGGTINLSGTGSSAAAGRTISAYAWTFASSSPATATLTGASTATPSFTAAKGSTYVPQLTVTDSEGETDVATTSIYPAASIVTHYDIDLTTATADATLADGDVIYESDGTTAIGTMRIGDGLISGSSNLLASIGSGGLEFEAELTSGSYTWAHCCFNLDSTNINWITDVVIVQLQYRVESIGSKVYEGIGSCFGEDGRPRKSGSGHNWTCMVIDNDVKKERAQDYPGNTAYAFGTDQATGATLPQEYVCAYVIEGGTIVFSYWRRGTTLFNGVPDPSDSDVYVQAFAETNAVGTSESKNFGNEIAVGLHGINYTAGAGAGPVAQLKRVKITSAGPGRD